MGLDSKQYKWESSRKMSMEILETWSNIKKLYVILQWDITMQKIYMKASCLNNEILYPLFTVLWKLYLDYCAYFLAKQLQKGTIEGVAKKEVKKVR